MRMLIGAAVAALAVAGAAAAQPYGYYPTPDADYAYRYQPPLGYDADGNYVPGYRYYNGYDGYHHDDVNGAAALGAAIGQALGGDVDYGHPAYDRYGPDPNGTIAPDGHRIKCKLVEGWDAYGRWGRHRECW